MTLHRNGIESVFKSAKLVHPATDMRTMFSMALVPHSQLTVAEPDELC